VSSIFSQRETPAADGERELRQRRDVFTRSACLHIQSRRHDCPHVGTIGHFRDSCPTLAGIPCGRGPGYRGNTPRSLRIPHGIGVPGAWHSLHSSVCKSEFSKLAAMRCWEAAPVTARRMSQWVCNCEGKCLLLGFGPGLCDAFMELFLVLSTDYFVGI